MEKMILLALPPALVIVTFLVHWPTILHLRSAEERLPYCRGAYLAFSLQLVLYSWVLFFLLARQTAALVLVPLGMSFSMAGDFFNLQFESVKRRISEPVFFGILSFIAAQLCYISAFLQLVELRLLLAEGFLLPLAVFLVLFSLLVFRLRVYNPNRPPRIMRAALIYGTILGISVAIVLSAAIVLHGWWIVVALGGLFFLLSDAVIGETTVHGRHPVYEYQIPWWTYLIAQGLIMFGVGMLYG
ncbi:MAG: lysoplasmalogenase [Spirochaetes bacterium]|nr:lysoplasmalogenase [Spirochaetota bacterium]